MTDDAPLGLLRGTVRVVGWTPRWAELYAEEECRLRDALGPLARGIEHYGSTSVPGLAAKPILDLLVGADDVDHVAPFVAALEPLGYEYVPKAGVDGHQIFGLGVPRRIILHLVPYDGVEWRRALRFRDALRADHRLAAAYEALKRELAQRYASDRGAYTAAKAHFILSAIGEADDASG